MPTPLQLNDPRYALTVTPDGFLAVEHVKKSEAPTGLDELARVRDAFLVNTYHKVVWLGQLPTGFSLDTVGQQSGFLGLPVQTLAEAVAAATAMSPTASSRALIVAVNANTQEQGTPTISSPYIDIVSVGRSVVNHGASTGLAFTSGGGNSVSGLTFVGSTYAVDAGVVTSPMFFGACNLASSGAVIVGAQSASTVTLDGCTSGASGAVYAAPLQPSATFRFLEHSVADASTLVVAQASAKVEVYDTLFGAPTTILSAAADSSVRIHRSSGSAITSFSGVASLAVDVESCFFTQFSAYCGPSRTLSGSVCRLTASSVGLGALQATLSSFTADAVTGVLTVRAGTVNPDCNFIKCISTNPDAAFGGVFQVTGMNAANIMDCHFTAEISPLGLFCGTVEGGTYRGVGRLTPTVINGVSCSPRISNLTLRSYTVAGVVYYPTLAIAKPGDGATNPTPIRIHGVHSQGILSSEMADWYLEDGATNPTRTTYLTVSESSFTLPSSGILKYFGAPFQHQPQVPGAVNIREAVLPEVVEYNSRIWVSGVTTLPRENLSDRQVGASILPPVSTTTTHYMERVASRFGRITFDLNDARINNPTPFLESLGIIYFHCRISRGQSTAIISHPGLTPWTILNYAAKPGNGVGGYDATTIHELSTARYDFLGDGKIKITLANPVVGPAHFDFIASTSLAYAQA